MQISRVLGLFSLVILLAACGGGGSTTPSPGGSTPPPPGGSTPPSPPSDITLTVEDPLGNFNAAAYQVGSGSWQALSMTGSSTKTATFSLAGQSKYGVAVRCGSSEVKVIQATAGELPNPRLECSSSTPSTPPTVTFTVNVNIDAGLLADGDAVCVNSTCHNASTAVSIYPNLEAGARDLLIVLFDSNYMVKVAKVVKDVNVSAGGSTDVSLAASDRLDPVSFTPATLPEGYTDSIPNNSLPNPFVLYLSANNTAMGIVNTSSTSYRPVSGFGSGDRYGIFFIAAATNASLASIQLFTGTPSLSLPAPWPTGSLNVNQTAHPSISGLSRSDSDLQGYQIDLGPTPRYTATLSKGWLGSATTYALPDLSGLLGYTTPTSGTGSLKISAILSNKNLFALDPDNPGVFLSGNYLQQSGDYLRVAAAGTNSFTVGGGPISLP